MIHTSPTPAEPSNTFRPWRPDAPGRWGASLVILTLFACTPVSHANADERQGYVVIEAHIVEASQPFFDRSHTAVAAAARGDVRELLLDGGSVASLGERLRAAEEAGALRILASPTFVATTGRGSHVQSGIQISVQTQVADTVTVQFVNATTRLDVTPSLVGEGHIALDLSFQKRFPEGLISGPSKAIQTTEGKTQAVVRDGGTAVLGGVFELTPLQEVPATGTPPELVLFATARLLELGDGRQ